MKMLNKDLIEKELKRKDFRVSIFGSARVKKGDKVYKQIYDLAKMLGDREIDIVTGGGPGLMEAANLGHKRGKKLKSTHSIGLAIKLPREQGVNSGVEVLKEFNRFSRRLDNFMLLSNVIVVAPGGVGTLLEFFYSWQLIQVRHVCDIPIILLGDQWLGLIKWLKNNPMKKGYFDKKEMHSLFLAKNSKEVVKIVDKAHENYKKGGKNFCLNYKKYRI
jgi:uncharacterized protein (TIGR00730 family)